MKPGVQLENIKLSSLQPRDNSSVEPWTTEVLRLYSPHSFPQAGEQQKSTFPSRLLLRQMEQESPIKRPLMKSAYTLDGIFKRISGNSQSSSPNGISKPIPDIINQRCYFMRVQISGHSSVQSSSTFRSRKADKPIYILRFKKIEPGQLLYPKIFSLNLLNACPLRSLTCSRMPKS